MKPFLEAIDERVLVCDGAMGTMLYAKGVFINRCFDALNPGGKLIIREGNADMQERHKGTKLTEFFSVKLLKFNKSVNPLNFVSGENIKELASKHGLRTTVLDDARFTSNVIFVIEE